MKTDNATLDAIWGARAIGEFIGLTERQAFWLLEQNRLPARKVGKRFVATRDALRRYIEGEAA